MSISNIAIICICGYCNNHDRDDGCIELNFREKKIFYMCSKCKKMNDISFAEKKAAPLPKTNIIR